MFFELRQYLIDPARREEWVDFMEKTVFYTITTYWLCKHVLVLRLIWACKVCSVFISFAQNWSMTPHWKLTHTNRFFVRHHWHLQW